MPTLSARRRTALPRFTLKRLAALASVFVFLAFLIYLFMASGSAQALREWGRERMMMLAANMGYRVQNIFVEGRVHTEADLLRGIINMDRGDPIFAFDPETARDLLRKVSWIRDADVRRQLPDTLYISLTERTPLALWQHEGKIRVIDSDGVVLTSNLNDFKDLMLIVGPGANKKAIGLIEELEAEPALLERVEAASWIGERRWDLKLKSGVEIKLPEDDRGLALRRLARAQENDKLLDRDVTSIDLREAGRFIIRTKPGAVQDYTATFDAATGGDI